MEKKLDELLPCGIIEEVPEGPTSWVSHFPLYPNLMVMLESALT